jgi:hypothetical protein
MWNCRSNNIGYQVVGHPPPTCSRCNFRAHYISLPINRQRFFARRSGPFPYHCKKPFWLAIVDSINRIRFFFSLLCHFIVFCSWFSKNACWVTCFFFYLGVFAAANLGYTIFCSFISTKKRMPLLSSHESCAL